MDAKLQRIVDRVKRMPAQNPSEDGVAPGTTLQVEIVRSDLEFREADVLEAAGAVGVSREDLVAWLEEMASWI